MTQPQSTFSMEIKGLDKLAELFKEAPEITTSVYKQALSRSKAILDATRIDSSVVPVRKGELARRWSTNYSDKFTLKTKPDVDYARVVQFGREIARNTTFHRTSAFGRKTRPYSFSMMWPTYPGRHYMEKIMGKAEPKVNEVFKDAIRVIIEKLSKS